LYIWGLIRPPLLYSLAPTKVNKSKSVPMSSSPQIGLSTKWINRLLIIQATLVLIFSLILLILLGVKAGYSGLLGGLAYILPNAFFSKKAFSVTGAHNAQQIMKQFYLGEVGKIVLTALFCLLMFKLVPLYMPAFMGLFMTAVLINFIGLANSKARATVVQK
jgi:ATP synthase protein I